MGGKKGGGKGRVSEVPACYVEFYKNRATGPGLAWLKQKLARGDLSSAFFYAIGRRGYPAYRCFPYVLKPVAEELNPGELRAHLLHPGGGMPLPADVIAAWSRPVSWVLWQCPDEGVEEMGRVLFTSTNAAARIEDATWPQDVMAIQYSEAGAEKGREEKLSRHLSSTLRHQAARLGLEMDSGGYVRLQDIFGHEEFARYTPKLREGETHGLVRANQKQRFELRQDRKGRLLIRCTQGHSVETVKAEEALVKIKDMQHFAALCSCSALAAAMDGGGEAETSHNTEGSFIAGRPGPNSLYPDVPLLPDQDDGRQHADEDSAEQYDEGPPMLRALSSGSGKRPAPPDYEDEERSTNRGQLVPIPKQSPPAAKRAVRSIKEQVAASTSAPVLDEEQHKKALAGGLVPIPKQITSSKNQTEYAPASRGGASIKAQLQQGGASASASASSRPGSSKSNVAQPEPGGHGSATIDAPATKIVHGTSVTALKSIIQSRGLKRMERNHIHFCMATADDFDGKKGISGMRDEASVIIEVDLASCLADDIPFFVSTNRVVLTEGEQKSGVLPLKFFADVWDRKTRKRHKVWEDHLREQEQPAQRRGQK